MTFFTYCPHPFGSSVEQKHVFHQFPFNDKKGLLFKQCGWYENMVYGLEILRTDRIMTKVYGKFKKKCEILIVVNIFGVFYF